MIADHLALTLIGVREVVTHEVHAATLSRRLEDFCDRRFKTEMRIGDDELHAA